MTLPLTPVQESMFLEAAQAQDPGIYLEQMVIHLNDEQIDPAAMQAAWNDVFIMQPALRLTINNSDPLSQSVHPAGPIEGKLIWTFPHSLLDGRSVAPVLSEVFNRYQGHRDGHALPPPTPPTSALAFGVHCRALRAMDQQPGVMHFGGVLNNWGGDSGLVDREAESTSRAFASETLT